MCEFFFFTTKKRRKRRALQHLEEIKEKDPKKYAQIVKELQEASTNNGEFAAKLPGGGVLGKKNENDAEGMEIVPTPGFVIKTYVLLYHPLIFTIPTQTPQQIRLGDRRESFYKHLYVRTFGKTCNEEKVGRQRR